MQLAQRALRGLAGFVGALKVKYQDIEVGLNFDPEPGLADSGDLEADLQETVRSRRRCSRGGRDLRGSLCRRTSICTRGSASGTGYRIAPDSSAATPYSRPLAKVKTGPTRS